MLPGSVRSPAHTSESASLCPNATNSAAATVVRPAVFDRLSDRNRAILQLICAGNVVGLLASVSLGPQRCRSGASASENSCLKPVTSARSVSSGGPACEETPRPSVVTVTARRIVVVCTYEVSSSSEIRDPQQVQNLKQARHFAASTARVDTLDHIATQTPGLGQAAVGGDSRSVGTNVEPRRPLPARCDVRRMD